MRVARAGDVCGRMLISCNRRGIALSRCGGQSFPDSAAELCSRACQAEALLLSLSLLVAHSVLSFPHSSAIFPALVYFKQNKKGEGRGNVLSPMMTRQACDAGKIHMVNDDSFLKYDSRYRRIKKGESQGKKCHAKPVMHRKAGKTQR